MSPLFGSRRPPSGGATFLFLGRLMASSHYRRILNQSRAFRESLTPISAVRPYGEPGPYAADPVGYCRFVLGHEYLTPAQEAILADLIRPPCRVMVPSGHNTGKTFLAAAAISWWFDSFNPGCVFTIGPRFDSLSDTIWGEVRRQRGRAGLPDHFIGPRAPHMETATDHWAKAFTASKDASLTGRHFPRMLFVIEEACAVDPVWWQVVMTMFDASLGHAQLCIFNPTDSTSQAFQEDILCDDDSGDPRWHRHRLSALSHPNVVNQLSGKEKIVPNAVSLEQVNVAVRDDCDAINPDPAPLILTEGDKVRCGIKSTDLEWPPRGECDECRVVPFDVEHSSASHPEIRDGERLDALRSSARDVQQAKSAGGSERTSDDGDVRGCDSVRDACPRCDGHGFVGGGRWYRTGPIFQARWQGLWPEGGSGVWSAPLWESTLVGPEPAFPVDGTLPQIGCDCAQGKGEDYHAVFARWGRVALFCETANVMDEVRIKEHLRDAARRCAALYNAHLPSTAARIRAQEIRIAIDDDGVGSSLVAELKREGYSMRPIGAATVSSRPVEYHRMRDELWFNLAEKARKGLVYFGRLDRRSLARLRQQLMAPEFDLNGAGQRVVERKDITKEKIKRSPDDADAANLAWLETASVKAEPVVNYRPPERRVR